MKKIRSILMNFSSVVIYFLFLFSQLANAVDNEEPRALQKQQEALAAQRAELAAKAKAIRAQQRLKISVELKQQIMTAVQDYMDSNGLSHESWESTRERWKDSMVLIMCEDNKDYFSIYFASKNDRENAYYEALAKRCSQKKCS